MSGSSLNEESYLLNVNHHKLLGSSIIGMPDDGKLLRTRLQIQPAQGETRLRIVNPWQDGDISTFPPVDLELMKTKFIGYYETLQDVEKQYRWNRAATALAEEFGYDHNAVLELVNRILPDGIPES